MKIKAFIFFILFFFSFQISLCADEQKNSIEKYGTGTVHFEEGGLAKVKKDALSGALLSAYQNSIFSILPEDIFQRRSEVVLNILNLDPVILAEEFQIVGESIKDNKYTVVVRASFLKKKLEDILLNAGIIIEKIHFPKILLLISQQNIEDYSPYRWWDQDKNPSYSDIEKAISAELETQGFHVDSPFIVKSHTDISEGFGDDLDKKEAINIGLKKQADMVIIGKAVTTPGKNKIGENNTIDVMASIVGFKTKTGEEVLSLNDHKVFLDEKKSYLDFFKRIGGELGRASGKAIFTYWKKSENKINEIELNISGNNYLFRFVKFKKVLIDSDIVRDIEEKEITSTGSKVTAYYKGTPDMLAKKIVELPFGNFGVDVESVSSGRIAINFIDPK